MDTGHVLGEQMDDKEVYEFADGDSDEEDYEAPETYLKLIKEVLIVR